MMGEREGRMLLNKSFQTKALTGVLWLQKRGYLKLFERNGL